jgi:hypothetical protein
MRSLLLAVVTVTAALGADWRSTPFPQWDEETVRRMVIRSPWAAETSVKLEWFQRTPRQITYKDIPGADGARSNSGLGPLGGIGAPKPKYPDKADLIVRWASALPVRQAMALYRSRAEKGGAERLNELVGVAGDSYRIEIFGLPVEMAHMGAESIEALAVQSVRMRLGSGRVLAPTMAKARLDGVTMSLTVHFSRGEPLAVSDREAELSGDLQILKFRVRFKLEAMKYKGFLEL